MLTSDSVSKLCTTAGRGELTSSQVAIWAAVPSIPHAAITTAAINILRHFLILDIQLTKLKKFSILSKTTFQSHC